MNAYLPTTPGSGLTAPGAISRMVGTNRVPDAYLEDLCFDARSATRQPKNGHQIEDRLLPHQATRHPSSHTCHDQMAGAPVVVARRGGEPILRLGTCVRSRPGLAILEHRSAKPVHRAIPRADNRRGQFTEEDLMPVCGRNRSRQVVQWDPEEGPVTSYERIEPLAGT